MENKITLAAALGFTAGLAVGAVTTYLTVKKTFEARSDRDIAEVKAYYQKLAAVEESKKEFLTRESDYIIETTAEDPDRPFTEEERQELIIEGQNVIENQGYWGHIAEKSARLSAPEFPPGNAFVQYSEEDAEGPAEGEAVVEFKIYERIDGEPYVISRLEFEDNLADYDQISLTYYDGDDTLCDDDDKRVPDIDRVIGQRNLEYFGHASDDERVVYIRNERFGTDYEVFKNDGEYTVTVLGLSDEDLGREPRKKKPLKMRDDE